MINKTRLKNVIKCITFICKIPVSGLLTKKVKPCSHTGSQERNMVAVLFVFPPILASR